MDSLQFFMPVRLALEAGEPVTEIYNVDQAVDFLLNWPVGRQGPVYQRALNACFAATVGQETTEKARKAFFNFARVGGLLAKDVSILTSGAARSRLRRSRAKLSLQIH
ncbi:DUF982 domain-containing protein [Mesorhizobium sp. KR1-2]|uniref:DUF982 domain-containing protein n=1 Tax=Mesorhizobium sp. KR1-2 TaxID=3156609 RepID=UPI0032B5CC85